MKRMLSGLGTAVALGAIVPVLAPVVVCVLSHQLVEGLYLRAWLWWHVRSVGKQVVFIYSNSPKWQAYIEENILPKIEGRAYVLNWSDRRNWTRDQHRLLRHFLGDREFCPAAIGMPSWWRARRVRLFKAFLAAKHGEVDHLRRAEAALFDLFA